MLVNVAALVLWKSQGVDNRPVTRGVALLFFFLLALFWKMNVLIVGDCQ